MLRRNECRLNFKNRPVRTGDLKGGPKQPPLPLIGVARSLPLIGLTKLTDMSGNWEFSAQKRVWIDMDLAERVEWSGSQYFAP